MISFLANLIPSSAILWNEVDSGNNVIFGYFFKYWFIIDLVFIYGDHSYEGTMIDLIGANKILKKNGLLIIDDVLFNDVKKI